MMQNPALPVRPYSYRNDPNVPAFPDDRPIIIFDGNCVLCSTFAQFILTHDRRRVFRLLAAQTSLGVALYQHFGLDAVNQETMVLLEEGRAFVKADGAMRIFARLGVPWSFVTMGRLLPGGLQDRLYDLIATNRFRWFGRRDSCFLPDPANADRFIA